MGQKGQLDSHLQAVLERIREQKEQQAIARSRGEQVKDTRPKAADWNGDLATTTGLIDMHKAFNTDQAEKELIEAHKVEDPGNTGDDIALTLQIDYAAQMERAYRAKSAMPFPRMLSHVAGREAGHGDAVGVIAFGLTEYAQRIVLQTADTGDGTGTAP